jgi:probable HAF family extracellular repeat protein
MRLPIVRFILFTAAITVPLFAQEQDADFSHPRAYVVENLDALGGSRSIGNSINDRGWIAGFSNLPGDQISHAALWIDDELFDLGTLGGPGTSSNINWPVKNNQGLLSGFAETDQINPLGEAWSCSAFFPTTTNRICLGVFWEFGRIHPLPTLGGYNGFAAGANNRGQIVGWAENTVHDPTCVAPQVLQFRAVLWEPRHGRLQELPPLPGTGDSVSSATVINDRGQVAGISGICDTSVGRFSARHAVLWEHGTITNLGTLGGVAWITPMAINNRGEVVGFSNINASDGGTFFAHAFKWTREDGMQDLGLLPGDERGQALGINDRGDVVGLSCPPRPGICKAVLWTRHGTIINLNDLVQPGYGEHLFTAQDITDRGVITGQARNLTTGTRVTFRATPSRR